MTAEFLKRSGNAIDLDRVIVEYHHDYGERVYILIREGWNEGCQFHANDLSLEEARDLHYMLERLFHHVENRR